MDAAGGYEFNSLEIPKSATRTDENHVTACSKTFKRFKITGCDQWTDAEDEATY